MNAEPDKSRSADTVIAWVLYALQLVGELALAPLWLMSIMMTDSCGSVADEPAVCNLTYFTTGWFAFAGLLVAAAVVTPVAIVVAGKRGNRRWKWPVIVIAALVAGTVAFVYAFTR
ncbi:MAG: hypothetical protein ACJ71Z_01935 [Aeromicrobium sp.]